LIVTYFIFFHYNSPFLLLLYPFYLSVIFSFFVKVYRLVHDYVCKKIEQNIKVSENEIELLWELDNLTNILDIIEKMPGFQNNIEENIPKAKDKIRIAIIIFLRKTIYNIPKLLEKIDMIYEDFDYPKDMEKFISYMPIDDNYISTNYSLDESRNYLLSNLDLFIKEQIKKYKLVDV